MRRTRHVVLPVRSWQYIGLLIVSLACLTLGLVSRDREGHAGSLAGPELTHRAPHEVDACPNLNPLVKSPIVEPEKVTKPAINNHQMKVSEFRAPMSRKFVLPRSLSLDRSSRSSLQETRRESKNRDLRTVERLSRSTSRTSNDVPINRVRESRFRTIAQSRDARNSFDLATRFSLSRDLSNRATGRRSAEQNLERAKFRRLADPANSRLENRRSRSMERRELSEIARQQNRDRSADRRDSLNLQLRTSDYRDRQSLPERRINRQESREVLISGRREHRDVTRNRVPNYRSEIHERRSVERRMSIEHRDVERSDRREDNKNLLKSVRFARGDIDRNNNMDRRNRERSLENRRALLDRVANQERRSRLSVATKNSRGDLVKSDDRRTLSRSMERSGINNLNRETLSRRVRSVEFNIERSEERRSSFERRSLDRSMERREIAGHQKTENRFGDRKSVDRMSRASSENLRRERLNRSQRTASRRGTRENTAIRENYRMARSRHDVEEIANQERRERFARSSRLVDRNSIDRREIARIRDSRDYNHRSRDAATAERRDSTQERRERVNRLYRSREEQRIVPHVRERSREIERRVSERRIPERRVLERRITLDSARLDSRRSSERRIDDSLKSREGSRLVDRSERSLETRVSRRRILEKRSILNSRRSSERRIDNSKSREELRLADRRSEQSPEARTSRRRIPEKRSILNSRRSSERRIDDNSKSREELRLADRRSEQSPEARASRGRILEKRSILNSRRSSERRIDDNSKSREELRLADRRSEQSPEARASRGRILEKRSILNSRRSSERRIDDNSKSREELRLADRRSEQSPEARVSRERILERRFTFESRRSLERRIDNLKSREGSRLADRRSERNLESRVSRGRILEKRSILDSRRSSERRINDDSRSREKSRMQDRHVERNSELRNSMLPMERKANSKTTSLENQVLRSSETRRESRRLAERRMTQSIENRPVEFRERESIRHLRQRSTRNIKDSSRLSSLRRVIRVPEQNREQRRLSAERTLTRTVDNERLSAKWEQNLQDARIERNMEIRAKIVSNSIKDYEFFKYPMAYDLMRQAFIVALCTVYGFSLYNGKKSFFGSNIIQHAQRFIVW